MLEIVTSDSRREPNQAIDFMTGVGQLRDMVERGTNKHIVSYKWACTDGVTPSNPNNEPGISKLMKVGSDVKITTDIIQKVFDNGLAENVAGVITVRGKTGDFVPVNVLTSRTVGDLNKSTDAADQSIQVTRVMADNDNVFGNGISSVRWIHNCDIITKWDCNDVGQEFEKAQAKYNRTETLADSGKVRFLMHIYENPEPDIHKSTTTPAITIGSDIDWSIALENTDIEKNKSMMPSEFTMVDILPYVNDGRIDPDYGADRENGSQFGGTLYYKKMVADFGSAPYAASKSVVYYTNNTAVRTATEQQLRGEEAGLTWVRANSNKLSESKVSFSIPSSATAIRMDTTLNWEESMSINLVANVTDRSQQYVGDYYHNVAQIMQGRGMIIDSNTVATQVVKLYISGTVWEDSDNDGLKLATEPLVQGVRVTLYKKYDPMNPNRIVRTINGVQLSEAFDNDNVKFIPQTTGCSTMSRLARIMSWLT